jgi:hypothetical protein
MTADPRLYRTATIRRRDSGGERVVSEDATLLSQASSGGDRDSWLEVEREQPLAGHTGDHLDEREERC